jgi:signal transduction histidine kinase
VCVKINKIFGEVMSRLLIGIRFYVLCFRWIVILTIFLIHVEWSQMYLNGYILLIAFNFLYTGFHFNKRKKSVWRITLLAEFSIVLFLNSYFSFELEQLLYLYTSCFLIGIAFSRIQALLLTFAYSILASFMTYELHQQHSEAESLFPLSFLVGFIFYLFFTHYMDNIVIILKKWLFILHYSEKLSKTDTLKALHELTERSIQKFIVIQKCHLCMYKNNSFIDDWYNQFYTRVLLTKGLSQSIKKRSMIKIDNYLGEEEIFLLIPIRLKQSGENLGGLLLPFEKKINLHQVDIILLRMILAIFISQWHRLILQENKTASLKAEVRSQLAQDLHDGLAQQLFFLSAQVFQMRNKISKENIHQIADSIRVMEQQTSACQNEVRAFIAHLKGERAESNIYDAIQKLVTRLTYNTSVKVSFDYHGEFFEESIEIEETIYRIVEETINNSLKHAKATTITVTVDATLVQWTIKIVDDGIGFVRSAAHELNSHSYGLSGLRERVAYLGGHISLSSNVGSGTEIVAVIPREGLRAYV